MPSLSSHPNRRAVLAGLALATPALAKSSVSRFAYVASGDPHGAAIQAFRLGVEGRLEPTGTTGDIANPTWLSVDAKRGRLFALSAVADYGPQRTGSVTAFRIAADGTLVRLNTVSSGGADPAHLALHPSGSAVYAANYAGGSVAVLPIADDGRLEAPTDVRVAAPAPPPPFESANLAISDHRGPHMHMVGVDPSGRWLLAADAGGDRVYVWGLDAAGRTLTPAQPPFAGATPGCAPRHFVFDLAGRRLFLLQEHDGQISTWRFDPANGALGLMGQTPYLPPGFAGSFLGSELTASSDGRFLYAANRLRDTVTVFAVPATGLPQRVSETWTQADYPRSFGITPDGRWLLACCERSDAVTRFAVDSASGGLTFAGNVTPVGSPKCIVFA